MGEAIDILAGGLVWGEACGEQDTLTLQVVARNPLDLWNKQVSSREIGHLTHRQQPSWDVFGMSGTWLLEDYE